MTSFALTPGTNEVSSSSILDTGKEEEEDGTEAAVGDEDAAVVVVVELSVEVSVAEVVDTVVVVLVVVVVVEVEVLFKSPLGTMTVGEFVGLLCTRKGDGGRRRNEKRLWRRFLPSFTFDKLANLSLFVVFVAPAAVVPSDAGEEGSVVGAESADDASRSGLLLKTRLPLFRLRAKRPERRFRGFGRAGAAASCCCCSSCCCWA